MRAGELTIRKVARLFDIFEFPAVFDIIAVDAPIGLLDAYEAGGRICDRTARKLLGRPRGSSVFPAPVRSALAATSWEDACARSRASAPNGKAITKQTFGILSKIKEVDEFLQTHPELREVVREVHPEVCFSELAGMPMTHRKSSILGREERKRTLGRFFPNLHLIEKAGRNQALPIEDILDATIACWSAIRLAEGKGRSLPDTVPRDALRHRKVMWKAIASKGDGLVRRQQALQLFTP
jgi:predicted RNase H-like nuclease